MILLVAPHGPVGKVPEELRTRLTETRTRKDSGETEAIKFVIPGLVQGTSKMRHSNHEIFCI